MVFSFLCSLLVGLYFTLLVFFSFTTHPVGYCLLLISGSICISLFSFVYLGFSWYIALFVLVYIGGVYVLFVFISLHTPNSFTSLGGSTFLFFLIFSLLGVLVFFLEIPCSSVVDTSHYLCSYMEGYSYLLLCFSLLVGLVGVSVVSSRKDSFFR